MLTPWIFTDSRSSKYAKEKHCYLSLYSKTKLIVIQLF